MSEQNEKQNFEPVIGQQISIETNFGYRKVTDKELKQIIEDHVKWIESDGEKGNKAGLNRTDLQGKDLSKANLQMANLGDANLQKANLQKTNLKKAYLWNADLRNAFVNVADLQSAMLHNANLSDTSLVKSNLQDAHLVQTNLNNANLYTANLKNTVLDGIKGLSTATLRYANFIGATGLLGNEFAQADVTGAKLPDGIKDFQPLEIVKETSQNARKIFFAMLLGCVYSWLTIATTTDVNLLTNSASSPLPIIQTEIPIAWFYFAAPLLLICLYFYFHLYLLKLWEGLASLPAIFPDGKRLDERAYPWLLTGLVRRHFKRLKDNRPFIAQIQEWITIFLAWWVVPITMIAFWLRFIPRHDWIGTILHVGLVTVSFAFAIIFYRLCATTLQAKEKTRLSLDGFLLDRRFYQYGSAVVVGIFFSIISYGAIEGEKIENDNVSYYDIKEIVPWSFKKVNYNLFADFNEKFVSEIPLNYGEISKDERLYFVKGANLKGRNLKNANLYNAFLVKADLRYANLQNANFVFANLQNANFSQANLQNASFVRANLQNVDFFATNLQNTRLVGANLKNADLSSANLNNASLNHANLQNAYLGGVNLQNAILYDANLHNADLRWGNLQSAILKNIRNITIDQLSKVNTLYKAKLDPDLLEQVKKCCPHLLEEPTEN